ncbi:MAG TPA: hypothetical protein VMD59_00890, partial [Acidimicrobiales bacterium]|nr:hypothetical protein [Acidimicrobiales bacterium]
MRHVPDGTLRRLGDEPFAVADRDLVHAGTCDRCRARAGRIGRDAARAGELLAVPRLLPEASYGWARLQRRLAAATTTAASGDVVHHTRLGSRRVWRLAGSSLGSGATAAAVGVVVAGVAAAATLTTVFAPTVVAPLPVTAADMQAMAGLLELGSPSSIIGSGETSGSQSLPFGQMQWSSDGGPQQVGSLAAAEAASGLAAELPVSLPNGVGDPKTFAVAPQVTVTIAFDAAAGSLAGSTLQIEVGPAIAVDYAGIGAAAAGQGAGPSGQAAAGQGAGTSGQAAAGQGAGPSGQAAAGQGAGPSGQGTGSSSSHVESSVSRHFG